MHTLHLNPRDPQIQAILAATYPEYTGQKVRLREARTYHLENYWSEGSRKYCVLYSLAHGRGNIPNPATTNPMNRGAHSEFEIPANYMIVEHTIFQGKDLGICLYVRPENLAPLLPAQSPALSERQGQILASIRSYISSYRRLVWSQHGIKPAELADLRTLGYLDHRGALTLAGKNASQPYHPF